MLIVQMSAELSHTRKTVGSREHLGRPQALTGHAESASQPLADRRHDNRKRRPPRQQGPARQQLGIRCNRFAWPPVPTTRGPCDCLSGAARHRAGHSGDMTGRLAILFPYGSATVIARISLVKNLVGNAFPAFIAAADHRLGDHSPCSCTKSAARRFFPENQIGLGQVHR